MVACDLGLSYKRHGMPEPHHICAINFHSRAEHCVLSCAQRIVSITMPALAFIEGFLPFFTMQADVPEKHCILLAMRQARLLHRSCHARAAMALI